MTTKTWPAVALGDVLAKSPEWIEIEPAQRYKQITVRLWGQGVVERNEVAGSDIGTVRRARVRAGQFILSRIDARNGALGVVPPKLDGAVVSNDFPVFDVRPGLLLPDYLNWLGRTDSFVSLCKQSSEGTTNRVRLKEDRFLAMTIPLPPLNEQRRIVARIEQLAAKIDEARGLRRQATDDAAALLNSQMRSIFVRLSEIYPPTDVASLSPHVTSGPRNWAKHYQQDGQRFYRAQDIGSDGSVVNDSKVFVTHPASQQGRSASLRVGDLMLVITGATVGRVALYHRDLEPGFVSQHVAICRLPQDQVLPEFALCGLRSPLGQEQLLGQRYGQGKPGLNLGNIRSLRLPFPPVAEQRRIVAYLDGLQARVDALKRLQAETATELDALLPSILDRAFKGEL